MKNLKQVLYATLSTMGEIDDENTPIPESSIYLAAGMNAQVTRATIEILLDNGCMVKYATKANEYRSTPTGIAMGKAINEAMAAA